MYRVNILKDSLAPCGERLTTFECTYPRIIHAEVMTHREFSRNAASSRAIPVKRLIDRVDNEPFVPVYWGKNKKGMSASEEIESTNLARDKWLEMKDQAVANARYLNELGVHKQIVNRCLEPFMFITTLITSNSFSNFFYLRDTWKNGSPGDAQPEIARLAKMMREAYNKSTPNLLKNGQWHLPLVELLDIEDPMYVDPAIGEIDIRKVSAARCARISYLTHFGTRDIDADVSLCDGLISNGHWSPLEHVARAESEKIISGNIKGFTQFRKMFENEYVN